MKRENFKEKYITVHELSSISHFLHTDALAVFAPADFPPPLTEGTALEGAGGAGAGAALGFGAALAALPCNTAFSEYSLIYK